MLNVKRAIFETQLDLAAMQDLAVGACRMGRSSRRFFRLGVIGFPSISKYQ